jgi:hypothetical protein
MWFSNVVLPAPKKPLSTVTGSRDWFWDDSSSSINNSNSSVGAAAPAFLKIGPHANVYCVFGGKRPIPCQAAFRHIGYSCNWIASRIRMDIFGGAP